VIPGRETWECLARRRVRHFGYHFSYVARACDFETIAAPFPDLIRRVSTAIVATQPLITHDFDQCTVNEYASGVGLSPHVDSHASFMECLAIVSLGSGTVMQFRRGDADDGSREQPTAALYLPPRSLLVLAGEARLGWQVKHVLHMSHMTVLLIKSLISISHSSPINREARPTRRLVLFFLYVISYFFIIFIHKCE
jgi:alkylated DNA repair dioxygenase AlkB